MVTTYYQVRRVLSCYRRGIYKKANQVKFKIEITTDHRILVHFTLSYVVYKLLRPEH